MLLSVVRKWKLKFIIRWNENCESYSLCRLDKHHYRQHFRWMVRDVPLTNFIQPKDHFIARNFSFSFNWKKKLSYRPETSTHWSYYKNKYNSKTKMARHNFSIITKFRKRKRILLECVCICVCVCFCCKLQIFE